MSATDRPIDEFTIGMPEDTPVSRNFRLYELTRSDIALRHGIDNRILDERILRNAVRLVRHVAQPIRDEFGPYRPNSLYRCQDLERVLKKKPDHWESRSQHVVGEAIDSEVAGVPNADLARWVRDNLEFDQLILECYNPDLGPDSGWVHISYSGEGKNRGEVLSLVKGHGGGYVYVPGIVADA